MNRGSHAPTRHARHHGLRWTAEEDQILLTEILLCTNFRAIGVQLGRTQGSVQNRVQQLRRQRAAKADGIRAAGA